MNKRMKKKMVTKKPSTKDRMKFYRSRAKGMLAQYESACEKNERLFDRAAKVSCEIVQVKRANASLADKNIELAKETASLEREINELQEVKRQQKKQIEQQEGQIVLLKYRSEKYKEQLEELQKPLWKKVLKK